MPLRGNAGSGDDLNALRCALGIHSGKIILNSAMPDSLRAVRHCIFTGEGAEDIANRFALSFNASCLCAELAAAVVLPVQAVLLRKLQAAQVAVVLFEVRGQMLYPELCLQFLPDGVDAGSVLVGADGQGGLYPAGGKAAGGMMCRCAAMPGAGTI